MAKKIVVSFESDRVSVVYGTQKGGNIVVQNTRTFPMEELDDFLKKEKAKEFTVVCDFETFFSEVVLIPPVKGKYFMTILQAEIKKTFAEIKEYSFFYTILEEAPAKGKKKQEVFVFAVNNDDIYRITDKFTRYGKRVNCFVPSILSLSRAVSDFKEPVLCLTKSGINKYLFLLKEGKILFIRSAQGIDSGIHDFDVENINMTLNHCRQSLKIDPCQVILLGNACFEYDATVGPATPLVCLDYRPRVLASKDTIIKFMSAIVCLGSGKELKDFLKKSNILPLKYKLTHIVKTTLTYATVLFTALFLAGAGYTALNLNEMLEVKKKVDADRKNMEKIEAIRSGYDLKKTEREKLMPLIKLVNRVSSEPDFQKLLIVLASTSLDDIRLTSISALNSGATLKINMKGLVEAEGINDTRNSYNEFIDSVKKIEGMNVATHKVEIQDKTFNIEATYKP